VKKRRRRRIFLLAFAVLVSAALIAARIMLSPDAIRRRTIEAFKKHVAAEVDIARVDFGLLKGIDMQGVEIYTLENGKKKQILTAERVFIEHRSASLLLGRLAIKSARLTKPRLFIEIREQNGKWTDNIHQIIKVARQGAEKKRQAAFPEVDVKDASVCVRYVSPSGAIDEYFIHNIDMELLPSTFRADSIYTACRVRDEVLGTWKLAGRLEPSVPRLYLSATSGELALSEELYKLLPERGRRVWTSLSPDGVARLSGNFTYDPTAERKVDYKVLVKVADLSITYKEFPYRLENLEGMLELNPEGVFCRSLSGRMGDLEVNLEGAIKGYGPGTPFEISVRARNLPLDEKLRSCLRTKDRRNWDWFSPEGLVDAEIRIVRQRGPKMPKDIYIELEALDCSSTYRYFPYALTNLKGHVSVKKRNVSIEKLVSKFGESVIEIRGNITDMGPDAGIDLTIGARNIALDERLKGALPASYGRVWDSFRPSGRINVFAGINRNEGKNQKVRKTIEVQCLGDGLLYDKFPYPLENITGQLVFKDDMLIAKDLSSEMAGGPAVRISGLIQNLAGECSLGVSITGRNVPLNDKLKNALSGENREIWDSFNPEGVVDVSCRLDKQKNKPLRMILSVESINSSICYDRFPLPVTDITGEVRFDEGIVKLYSLKGRHGKTLLRLGGQIDSIGTGSGIKLTISAEGLSLDDELKGAIPDEFAGLYEKFEPSGVVDLSASLYFVPVEGGTKRLDFTADLEYKDVSVTCGVVLEDMVGKSKLSGGIRAGVFEFEGESEISKATIEKRKFTEVTNVFQKKGNILSIYGISGRIYGGVVEGAAKIDLSRDVSYGCIVDIRDIRLERVLSDVFGYPDEALIGKVSGKAYLQGRGTEPSNLVSRGEMRISEAVLWEVPVIFQIFDLLKLTAGERSAFDEAVLKYYLLQEQASIDQIDLKSDTVSIYGEGIMGFDGSLDLAFVAGIGKRQFPKIPLLSGLIKGIKKQVMELRVSGTFENPKTTIEPIKPVTQPIKDLLHLFNPAPSDEEKRK